MRTVGLYEAKHRLSALLDRVAKGEETVITRRAQKAALLVPPTEGGNEARRKWCSISTDPGRAPAYLRVTASES